ncbi:hypothetical protein Syun_020480 [Stephania yunnanensis]|uniref:C2 domain-containing protein n=1 Tax=Stephania yunnanensis TaxID=152371 RepID=A0AAP0IE04_9MAGN
MQGGVLEVLLASAESLKNTNILGKSRYYVVIKCGNQEHISKTASGEDGNVYWNEKHRFEFSNSDCQNLKHLMLKIMKDEYLSDPDFVGETIVHLGGLITEGNARGHIELKPAPFNVVLEDDTYKGELKIGFKFIPNVEVIQEKVDYCDKMREENQRKRWMERKIINFQRIPWRWLFFFYKRWKVPNGLNRRGRE